MNITAPEYTLSQRGNLPKGNKQFLLTLSLSDYLIEASRKIKKILFAHSCNNNFIQLLSTQTGPQAIVPRFKNLLPCPLE